MFAVHDSPPSGDSEEEEEVGLGMHLDTPIECQDTEAPDDLPPPPPNDIREPANIPMPPSTSQAPLPTPAEEVGPSRRKGKAIDFGGGGVVHISSAGFCEQMRIEKLRREEAERLRVANAAARKAEANRKRILKEQQKLEAAERRQERENRKRAEEQLQQSTREFRKTMYPNGRNLIPNAFRLAKPLSLETKSRRRANMLKRKNRAASTSQAAAHVRLNAPVDLTQGDEIACSLLYEHDCVGQHVRGGEELAEPIRPIPRRVESIPLQLPLDTVGWAAYGEDNRWTEGDGLPEIARARMIADMTSVGVNPAVVSRVRQMDIVQVEEMRQRLDEDMTPKPANSELTPSQTIGTQAYDSDETVDENN